MLGDNLRHLLTDAARPPLLLAELYFRMVEIGATVGKHALSYSYDHMLKRIGLSWIGRRILGARLQANDRRLVNVFEELGPAFIKIGQVLSTRPDLVSERIASELRLLQDNVTPFGFDDVVKTIEEEFHRPLKSLFTHFDVVPVASASIEQVHRARLRNGTEVAVKVQRPAIDIKAKKDLLIFKYFFAALEQVVPHFRNLSTAESVQEIGDAIARQIDFRIEADNNRRFVRNFESEPRISFPRMYDRLCSRRVLTMEFVHGARGDRPADIGADPGAIARLGLKALVKMSFVDGFLHCDPHPGNIFILPDNRVMFIDLGLAAELSHGARQTLLDLIGSLVQGNVEQTARLFLKTCDEKATLDMDQYVADIGMLIDRHLKTTISQMEATLIFKNLFEIVWKHSLKLNAEYALVFMALITVEGVGKSLQPDLDLMGELQAIIAQLLFVQADAVPSPS